MKIQRLSIDMNYLGGVSSYERNRLSILGAHIERLFFSEGFQKFEIPDANFVHLPVNSDPKFSELIFPTETSKVKKAVVDVHLDLESFFKSNANEQINVLLNTVYSGLMKFAEKHNLDINRLNELYAKILSKQFFLPFFNPKEGINPKQKKIQLSLDFIWFYNMDVYQLKLLKNKVEQERYKVCKLAPIHLPADDPSQSVEKIIRFPEIKGWTTEQEFIISFGYKDYIFSLEERSVKAVEKVELRSNYINWQSLQE